MCCLLLVRCLLLVVSSVLLHGAGWGSSFVVRRCLLFVVCWALFGACCLLWLLVDCWLLADCCLLAAMCCCLGVRCSLLVVCRSLFVIC